jgi:hypothetical protein
MKPTKKSSATGRAPGSKPTASSTASSQKPGAHIDKLDKNSKEALLKKLGLCCKTYDYKDETKDVKAKTERLNAIQEL